MGKVLIKDTTLTDIANAIRTKDGSTTKMYPNEMARKIGNISTGVELPDLIVGGNTPIYFIPCHSFIYYGHASEVLGISIKKSGTYRFGVYATGGEGSSISLYKNGARAQDFEQNINDDYEGCSFLDLSCAEGDSISLYVKVGSSGSGAKTISIYGFIISMKWDLNEFTKITLSSEVKKTSQTSSGATGVYINIPQSGTYKFNLHAEQSSSSGTWNIQLHKNGSVVSGSKITSWTNSHGRYIGNISCNKGDRIEVFVDSMPSGKRATIYTLFAEEI